MSEQSETKTPADAGPVGQPVVPLVARLRDEADLCRNDGATDIANLLDEAAAEIERLQKLLNLQQQSYEREIALEVAAERERLRALVQAVRDANAADSAPRMLTARQEAAWVALMDGLDGSSV